MIKFIKKLIDKILKFNNSISSYRTVTKEVVIPSRAFVNWGIYLANSGEVNQAIEKFESSTYMRPQTTESFNNWGIALATQGNYEEAIEKFRKALKIDSKCVKSYALWGAALIETGKFEEAEEMYKKALSLNSKNAEIYINWGIALARQNYKPLAEIKFKKAVDLSPRSHQAIFLWGVVLVELERYNEAIEKFVLSTKIQPNNPDAWYYWSIALLKQHQLGNKLQSSKDVAQLEESYEKGKTALDMISSRADFQINMAEILTEMKKYDKAVEYYKISEKTNPENAQLYLCWGITLQKYGEHFEAINKLNKSIEIKSDQSQAQYYLAISLAETGDLDKAEEILLALVEKDSRYIEAYIKLGAIAGIKGNTLLAIERYKQATKFNRKKTEANYLIASAYSTLNDFSSALEYYQKSINEDPAHLDSYVGYAVALNEIGDEKEAIRKIRNAYKMAPDSAQICMIYGIILSKDDKNLKDAVEKFNNAIKINSDMIPAYIGKGEALIRLKNFEEALAVFHETLFKIPNLVPALFLIGGAYIEMADYYNENNYLEHAAEFFNKVIQIEPNHIDSLSNLAYLKAKNGDFEAFEQDFKRLHDEYPEQRELIRIYLVKSLEKLHYEKSLNDIIG